MKQRFPSFFKMKTERVKEARSIRRGIRDLWGTWMTHNQTKPSTVCVCVFVCLWIPMEQISVGKVVEKQKMMVLNTDTSHTSGGALLESVQVE